MTTILAAVTVFLIITGLAIKFDVMAMSMTARLEIEELSRLNAPALPSRRERIEEALKNIRDLNPDLSLMVSHCHQQLISFDNHEKQIDELSRFKDAPIIDNLKDELGKVEDEILQNMEDIISICIAAGATTTGKVEWRKVDTEEIDQELKSNQIKLNKIDELLKRLVVLTNQHDGSLVNLSLDSWLHVVNDNIKSCEMNKLADEKANTM